MQTQRVVIVGGGMMGVSLLYHLARLGWKDLLLIEKGELTSGSTWHAAGQCASFLGSFTAAQMHHEGVKFYPQLERLTGQYTGWHGCGGIRFATTPEEVDWFHQVESFSHTIGFRMQVVGPDEIRRLNPFVTLDGVLAGAWTLDDGHVDPTGCCNAMAAAARALGAVILRHSRVTAITAQPNGEWLVASEKGSFLAEHVVNSAGCYAREVGEMVGLRLPLVNMTHQYVVTEAIPEFQQRSEEIPVMRDSYTRGYYRQEQKAGLIGVYETHGAQEAWPQRGGTPQWQSDNELFPGDLDRIEFWLQRAVERMPVFGTVGIKRVINGAIAHSPDGNPLLGPVPGRRNFWLCCGSSVGIAQGSGCGKYVAQWMAEGAAEVNMRDFDSRRFGPFANLAYTRARCIDDYHHMFVPHLPGEERQAGRPARTSPLFLTLARKGAVHTEGGGFERPKWFSTDGSVEQHGFRRNNAFAAVREECRAVAERVGVCDLTSFAKFEVRGRNATAFLDRILSNRLPRRTGGIVLAHLLTDGGRIETEFTVTRVADDQYYLLSSIAAEQRDLDFLSHLRRDAEQVTVENVTERYGNLVVAGPRSRELLSGLTPTNLRSEEFPWLTARPMTVAGVPLLALRVNYVGELGWELHAPMDSLPALYHALFEAGDSLGIRDFGLYAINSLRMEKAYRGWGHELTNEVTLVDADMLRFFAPDKGEFRGRNATLSAQRHPQPRLLVCLKVDPTDVDPRGSESVWSGDNMVGLTTSGAYGHRTGAAYAFAYVDRDALRKGAGLSVSLLGRKVAATVLARPAFDPDNARLRC